MGNWCCAESPMRAKAGNNRNRTFVSRRDLEKETDRREYIRRSNTSLRRSNASLRRSHTSMSQPPGKRRSKKLGKLGKQLRLVFQIKLFFLIYYPI